MRNCPTCGRALVRRALEDWQLSGFLRLMERAYSIPEKAERAERINGICEDYGISRRTAQRYWRASS